MIEFTRLSSVEVEWKLIMEAETEVEMWSLNCCHSPSKIHVLLAFFHSYVSLEFSQPLVFGHLLCYPSLAAPPVFPHWMLSGKYMQGVAKIGNKAIAYKIAWVQSHNFFHTRSDYNWKCGKLWEWGCESKNAGLISRILVVRLQLVFCQDPRTRLQHHLPVNHTIYCVHHHNLSLADCVVETE